MPLKVSEIVAKPDVSLHALSRVRVGFHSRQMANTIDSISSPAIRIGCTSVLATQPNLRTGALIGRRSRSYLVTIPLGNPNPRNPLIRSSERTVSAIEVPFRQLPDRLLNSLNHGNHKNHSSDNLTNRMRRHNLRLLRPEPFEIRPRCMVSRNILRSRRDWHRSS